MRNLMYAPDNPKNEQHFKEILRLMHAAPGKPYLSDRGVIRGLRGQVPSTQESWDSEDTFYFCLHLEEAIATRIEEHPMPKPARPKTKTTAPERRTAEIAKIHIAKKQLGMDETTYRMMLQEFGSADSCAKLDAKGRKAVLQHLRSVGFVSRPGKKSYPGRPPNMNDCTKGPLLRKIEALLANSQLPWEYASGIAKRMFKIENIESCSSQELHKVAIALIHNAQRHNK